MGLLQNLLKKSENKEEFKQQLKEAQMQRKIEKIIMDREKSANERELERDYEEKRQAEIKRQLDMIRKKRTQENWKTKKTILSEPTTMLNEGRPILKEKNIFKGNDNMFTKKHCKKNKTDMGFFK